MSIERHYAAIRAANGGYVPEDQVLSEAELREFGEAEYEPMTADRPVDWSSTDVDSDDTSVEEEEQSSSRNVYSSETLKSLIPATPEFSSLREKMGLQKTVLRYSPEVSNRTFKRRFFFKHGHVPSNLLKVECVLEKDDLIPVLGKRVNTRPPFGGKPIVRRFKTTRKGRRIQVHGLGTKHRVFYPKVAPKPHHKKYWYFFRKTGSYRTSGHHPYGDEYEAYASDPT
jgi:hypothetical protein